MQSDVLALASLLAKPFEGLSLKAYHDPVGYPTIGYGHLLSYKKWEDLAQYPAITEDDADELLMQDMVSALTEALKLSPILASDQKRHAAITDFIFNCGGRNYAASTLRRKVNAGDWVGASEQIKRWNKADGKVLKGLTLRRAAEARWLYGGA